jgi:hypothetical protein
MAILYNDLSNASVCLKTHASPSRVRHVRHGQVGRLQVPIAGAPQNRFGPLEIHRRPLLFRSTLVNEIDFQSRLIGNLFHAMKLIDTLVAKSDSERADLAPARLCLFVALELRKRFDGPHREFGPFDAVANLSDEAGRLRRCDRCQRRLLFQQKDVGFPGLCQTISDGATDSTASDDHDFRSLGVTAHDDTEACAFGSVRKAQFARREFTQVVGFMARSIGEDTTAKMRRRYILYK